MEKIKIDITPTWSAVAEVCIRVYENPNSSSESRVYARSELKRIGKIADEYVELAKKGEVV